MSENQQVSSRKKLEALKAESTEIEWKEPRKRLQKLAQTERKDKILKEEKFQLKERTRMLKDTFQQLYNEKNSEISQTWN
jgi:hypothetical protein